MLNQIFLRRRNKIVDLTDGRKASKQQLASLNANLQVLGYILEPKLAQSLRQDGLADLAKAVIQTLQIIKGVKNYSPVYPNFPDQVMEASEAELYWNATIQYFHDWVADLTGDRSFVWAPAYDKKDRGELKDKVKLSVISLGTEDELKSILSSLIASNTSVSQQDKDDVSWFLNFYGFDNLPKNIPHKEMLGLIGSLAIDKGIDLSPRFKTATDVLRLATAMSGGDVSLAENTKFKSFSRPQRRALLSMLNQCNEPIEDMLRHKERWLRLGERLHPGEYKNLTTVAEAFEILREGKPFQSFASKVEQAIKNEDVKIAVGLLKTRPGSFARRLDQLLRIGTRYDQVVGPFLSVAEDVSTPVLLQAKSHFEERMQPVSDLRVFFPKGAVAKVQAIKNELEPIKNVACRQIMEGIDEVLVKRFAKLPSLGRCRIDEVLREVIVPFSQRSASRSLRTITRGSRLPFGIGGDTVRFFIWWKEKDGDRTDVDLSATYFNEQWRLAGCIAYYNLRDSTAQACHSGDRTSAPNGACEFIDLHIPSCLKQGRYVIMNVNSFTGQKFSDMPECFAGWMIRQHPGSGEIFDPKTVKDRLDVGSDSTQTIPMILDLQERKVIWTDVNLKANPRRANNVHHNLSNIALFGKAFTEMKKPNLYDLIALHVRARGILVENGPVKKIFSIEDALNIEKVMSEFLV